MIGTNTQFMQDAQSYLANKYGSVDERYVDELADALRDYDRWQHGHLMMSEREYSRRVKAIHAKIKKEKSNNDDE